MQYAVRYQSRGGSTRKVAEAIAGAVGVQAEAVGAPLTERVELLFLGGGVYAGGVDAALKAFIQTLTPDKVDQAAVFSTAAIKQSAYPEIKQLLEAQGIRVSSSEFHCRGQFTLVHRGRPNAEDLREAAQFAKAFMK